MLKRRVLCAIAILLLPLFIAGWASNGGTLGGAALGAGAGAALGAGTQDYPDYQVVFCVQDPKDPALPLVWEIQEEFGVKRVAVVVADVHAGPNGKVNNLLGNEAATPPHTTTALGPEMCYPHPQAAG